MKKLLDVTTHFCCMDFFSLIVNLIKIDFTVLRMVNRENCQVNCRKLCAFTNNEQKKKISKRF